MVNLTNEILMAYADDELDPVDRAEVEAAIRMDPDAGRRLEIFLATGAPIADFFEPLLDKPVPDHLVRLVKDDDKKGRSGGTVLPFPGPIRTSNSFGGSWQAMVAASLVTVVAATTIVLYLLQAGGGDKTELVIARNGHIFAQGLLETTLETVPSGTEAALDDEASPMTARMILTFRNRKQLFCRQYEVNGPADGYSGVACRNKDGEWQVEMHIAASTGAQHDTGQRITPAGGTASDVRTAVSNVIDGDAFGKKEEQALIERHWQPSEK